MLLLVTMDKVVKVDSELLKKIQELIKKKRFYYSSCKQVVNLAILNFLNNEEFLNKGSLRGEIKD